MASESLLKTLVEQEANLRFDHFDASVAWEVGSLIRTKFLAEAASKFAGKGIVVSISLFTGQVLFSCAAGEEGTTGPDNWTWVKAKENVVKRFSHSSYYHGRKLAAAGKTPESAGLNFPEYACHGGAFPIWLKALPSAPVGTIIVSGLKQEDDHKLVVDALADYLKQT